MIEEKKYAIKVAVTYTMVIPVKATDEDTAVDKLDEIIGKSDDYEIVNRSIDRSVEIKEIKVSYE